jgi:3-hydroxyisobutyrate dehydrogenase
MHIGYIGLGATGAALARTLFRSHTLSVWDIDSDAMARFEVHGACAAASAAEVAQRCDVVLVRLPRSTDLHKFMFGPRGLADGLAIGKVIIDQTSRSPGETRAIASQLAERGVAMIDAPVCGGVEAAGAGTVTVLASGPDDVFAKIFPLLNALSPKVVHCGSRAGDAQAMRLVMSVLSAGCCLSTFEAVAMGRKLGLSLRVITDVINSNSGCNWTSKVSLRMLVDGKSPALGINTEASLADIDQAIALAAEQGVFLPLASVVRGLLQSVGTLPDYPALNDAIGRIGATAAGHHAGRPDGVPAMASTAAGLKIGYVGLGEMGAALARRVRRRFKVTVFDIRPEAVFALAAEGAVAAADLASLARACDVIMICMPTSAEVREVIFGKGGLADGLSAGKIVIDQTSGDPVMTRGIAADLGKLDVSLVDATISGAPRTALAGTIAIMCGGPPDAVDRVRPILESLSPNISYCGDTGNGHAAKLLNHAVAPCNRLLTYEAVALGLSYGLSIDAMCVAINQSTGWSRASEKILPALAAGAPTATMQLGLMARDLQMVAQMAIGCGAPLLIANQVRSLFEVGAHEFGATQTLDAMARLFEKMAGVSFQAPP